MRKHRLYGVLLAVCLAALVTAAPALANQSTTMYPSGDTVALSSAPVTLTWGAYNWSCTWGGWAFKIATSHNASGPVTNNFTTTPTVSSCTGSGTSDFTVSTSGTWTISAQTYSLDTPSVTVPAGGIKFTLVGYPDAICSNTQSFTFSGTSPWWNGFTSPTAVPTLIDLGTGASGIPMGGVSGCSEIGNGTINVSAPGAVTLTDTTNPNDAPVLGP